LPQWAHTNPLSFFKNRFVSILSVEKRRVTRRFYLLLFQCNHFFGPLDDLVGREAIHFKQCRYGARATENVFYTHAQNRYGAALTHRFGNSGTKTADDAVLLRGYKGTRLLRISEKDVGVKRLDGVHVDHSGGDALLGEHFARLKCEMYHVAVGNQRDIRTVGKQGLRFISSFAKSGDWAAIKEVGTVLIPTADLADASDLVIGYSANGHDALVVPAVKYYSEDDNKIEYTAVITDIAAANYGRAISARSYAIVVDVYGVEHTIYGDAVTSRSVLQVAQNGLLDPNASDEEKAIFQEIVDAANA